MNKAVLPREDLRAGVYIHVPFCARLCPYCDFAVAIKAEIPHEDYARALLEEFAARHDELEGRDVQTVYFGGGTPSLWEVRELRRVLDVVRERYGVGAEAESTIEANPNQITKEKLRAWTEAGINRVSIGVQSFQGRMLKALRRNHGPEEALDAVRLAIEHIPSVSLDLMFGGPGQTMEEWQRDLDVVSSLEGLSHVSAYHLTIEPGTSFFMRQRRGTLVVTEDDVATDMMDRLVDHMIGLGFDHYEVCSFGRPGAKSRHNTNYWLGGEYLGLGVGAHSLRVDGAAGVIRRANPRKLNDYLASPTSPADLDLLDGRAHLAERIFLGMRTVEGLTVGELTHQFGEELVAEAKVVLDALVGEGLLWYAGLSYGPTRHGLFLADTIAERVFEAIVV